MSQAHRSSGWRKLRNQRVAIGQANSEPCSICSGEVDYTLRGNARWAPTAEHATPLAFGGDLLPPISELFVAHRYCQGRQGAAISNLKQGTGAGSRGGNASTYSPRRRSSSPVLSGPNASPRAKASVARATAPIQAYSGDPYNPPRILTPIPPDAVGSLADDWIPWLEGKNGPGLKLRQWQREVLERALAVDSNGKLLFRDCVISTPRQSGKSRLLLALATARCEHAARFGEPQTLIHISNNLSAARRVHTLAWRWAESRGMQVRQSMGREVLVWPDGSEWEITSSKAVWGVSSSTAMVDEAWDLALEIVTSAIQPTLTERFDPQIWITSTSNAEATALVPSFRRAAIDGAPRTFIAEWSAPPDADLDDPEVWRAASPYWSTQRHELMAAAVDSRGFAQQWLNIWPDSATESAWLPSWTALEAAQGDSRGGVGALEVSADRRVYGASTALRRSDGSIHVWTGSFSDLDKAVAWMIDREPSAVVAGISIRDQIAGPWDVKGVGVAETRFATPSLKDAVRRGIVRHDHDPDTDEQFRHVRVADTEHGEVISAKRSQHAIPTAKAVAWSVWAVESGQFAVAAPEIW